MDRVYKNDFQALICLKLMLIEGANRDIKTNDGRKAVDMVRDPKKKDVQAVDAGGLQRILGPQPWNIPCRFGKPLFKEEKSFKTWFLFVLINTLVYTILTFFVFPYRHNFGWVKWINGFFFISNVTFLIISLMNPGREKKIVTNIIKFERSVEEIEDPTNLCPCCEIMYRKGTRHCTICNQCMSMYDHHCPWLNTCVAKNNHKLYYVFIISLLTCFVLIALMVFWTLFTTLLTDEDLLEGHTYNLLGMGQFDKANDLPKWLRLFNV